LGDTELIRDFVNTKDLLDDKEAFATPAELDPWLREAGLLRDKEGATAADLAQALELREALRQILLANTGVEIDTHEHFDVLDAVAHEARIELCFEECAGELSPAAGGVPAALGRVVIAVHRAMGDGSWGRLKACRAFDCEWAFIDGARNQSRAWCSMRSCGNREKARQFRERQRVARASSSSSR
jgi:predicted RNA-binding Zn ribbon-like protein